MHSSRHRPCTDTHPTVTISRAAPRGLVLLVEMVVTLVSRYRSPSCAPCYHTTLVVVVVVVLDGDCINSSFLFLLSCIPIAVALLAPSSTLHAPYPPPCRARPMHSATQGCRARAVDGDLSVATGAANAHGRRWRQLHGRYNISEAACL